MQRKLAARQKKCKHCGEILDAQMRELDFIKNKMNSPQVITNVATSTSVGGGGGADFVTLRRRRFKSTASNYAFLLGGIGAHKFYLGQPWLGLLYLAFSWTLIPMLLGIIEAIYFAMMDEATFDAKYNSYVG